jgi:heterodisulfide reductase subunit B
VLKAVGGYDTRFLKGTQGYEDDSLLVGIRYYLGTKTNWKPKCFTGVRVYHATLVQRVTMPDINEAFRSNLRGLVYQYGVKGLMELTAIYPENKHFRQVADDLLKQLE